MKDFDYRIAGFFCKVCGKPATHKKATHCRCGGSLFKWTPDKVVKEKVKTTEQPNLDDLFAIKSPKRTKSSVPTQPQIELLKRFAVEIPDTLAEASRQISRIAACGWKTPPIEERR